jgi:hypothetical protein
MNSATVYSLLCMTFARISRFYFWLMNNPLFSPTNYYKTDEKRCVYVMKTTDYLWPHCKGSRCPLLTLRTFLSA